MDTLERYVQKGFREVRGWLSPEAVAIIQTLSKIQHRFGVQGPIGEIGVHHGRLFILLHLLTGEGERSVAFDLFELQKENIDGSGKGDKDIFLTNCRMHGCRMRDIKAITGNSLHLDSEKIRQTLGGNARLFSVDGGHAAETTFHDLQTVSGALCEGGVLILDDVFNDQWPGVAEGTFRFFFEHPHSLFPIAIGANKMLFSGNRDFAQRYREALAEEKIGLSKWGAIFDEPVLILSFPKRNVLVRFIAGTKWWQSIEHRPLGKKIYRVYRILMRKWWRQ